ncbi:helix-turn-helix domain-containing protein [Muriicola soli]|uniref:AraC family transcriptional regulator n=1 Tax=Muriicola soli TaxID=2507538 RepID=A0A411E928_9FLAO|nr:helix-turn-helix transcriptional regulator [Muriicola soli]QBA64235.1 AraC family transcriptional regulator [Muriicola soli]
MNWIAIINFLLIAGAIQGFIFFGVTFLLKKKIGPAILFLILTVLFISLNNLQAWLIDSGYSTGLFYLKHMLVPWYLLILPCFYSFLLYYLKVDEKLKSFINLALWILLAELVIRTILIAYVYYLEPSKDVSVIEGYTAMEEVINAIFSLIIFSKAIILVFKKTSLYSEILSFDDIKWIKAFLILGSAVFLLWIIAMVVFNSTGNETAYYPLRLATSFILYWIGYQGLFRYTIIQDRILLRKSFPQQLLTKELTKRGNDQKSDFVNEKHNKSFSELEELILTHQKYLDPLLSLEKLAAELAISPGHLSKLINVYSGQHFSDYINGYRIEQSKKLLSDSTFQPYTIVAIGLECGFNSKSTFYTAFKKFTGQTPSDFRAQYD